MQQTVTRELPQSVRNRISTERCPACHSESPKPEHYRFEQWSAVRCPDCEVLFLSPLPDLDSLERLYNASYFHGESALTGYRDYRADEALIRKTYSNRIRKLLSTGIITPSLSLRIHEIGCAMGFGLEVIRESLGGRVSGSEFSPVALQAAAERGFEVYRSDAFGRCSLPESPKIDLLLFFDVIEHFTDLPSFQRWMLEILAPDAVVAFTTMDLGSLPHRLLGKRSPSFKLPEHVLYFRTATLRRLLGPELTLRALFADTQYTRVSTLLEKLRGIVGLSHRPVKRLDRWTLLIPNGMNLYVFQRTDHPHSG